MFFILIKLGNFLNIRKLINCFLIFFLNLLKWLYFFDVCAYVSSLTFKLFSKIREFTCQFTECIIQIIIWFKLAILCTPIKTIRS